MLQNILQEVPKASHFRRKSDFSMFDFVLKLYHPYCKSYNMMSAWLRYLMTFCRLEQSLSLSFPNSLHLLFLPPDPKRGA